MPDFSNTRPSRWWVLEPDAHRLKSCGKCGADLDTELSVPMLNETPLCAVCSGHEVRDAPVTVEYAIWLSNGDPRWWSAWLCNCKHCYAEGAM